MADENPHGDLLALILVFIAAVFLAAVVWLLMCKYHKDQVKSFECTPPRLASPIATPSWDSSLFLGTDHLQQRPTTRQASDHEQSASASRLTSTAADTSQADQSKLEAEDKSKPPPEPKAQSHRHQSGSTVMRDSKGAAKRPAKTKDAEAGRRKSRTTSSAFSEKSLRGATKRRSKHRRPERISPEVINTAAVDGLSVATSPCPHQEAAIAAASSASTAAALPPPAPASATGAALGMNSTGATEHAARDNLRKTSTGEELSPVSAAASMKQAATSPEEGNH